MHLDYILYNCYQYNKNSQLINILIEHSQHLGAANLCVYLWNYRHRAHNVECQMANGTNDNKDLTKHDHHQMRDWPPLSLSCSFSLSVTVAILIIFELYLFMYIQCTNSSRVNYSSNNFLFLAISNLLLSPPIESWNCNYNLWGSHIHWTQLLFQKT